MSQSTILYVEDETDILTELREILEMKYDTVYTATNGEEGLAACQTHHPDLIVTDIQMPIMDGLEMAKEIRTQYPDIPIIITSAFNDTNYLIRAISLGISHYIIKPINPRKLLHLIDEILDDLHQKQQIKEQHQVIEQMMQLSPNPVFSVQHNSIDAANVAFLELMRIENLPLSPEQSGSVFRRFSCQICKDLVFSTALEWVAHIKAVTSDLHAVRIKQDENSASGRIYKLDALHSESLGRSFFTLTDITELENARSQMVNQVETSLEELERQRKMLEIQSRLAQMGEMIGAISHQWKQPITIIGMNLELMEMKLDSVPKDQLQEVQEGIAEIRKSIFYMNDMIEDFKNFFSPTKESRLFTLQETLDSIDMMVGKQYRNQEIEFQYSGDLSSTVKGHINEFQQALINLFNNAMDAFLERNISERSITLIAQAQQEEATLEIKILDNAGGIPENALPHLFEPFFTTKGKKGTGIGLHLVKMIIEESMKGSITAHNEQKGACFTLKLPLGTEE